MKRIRQGNSINFRYSVYRAVGELKEPEDLTGVALTASLQNRLYGTRVDVPFFVEGNVLTAQIPGLPLLKTGVYNFFLSYQKDGWDFAIDADAFQIVDSSAKAGGADTCPDVEAETVELTGTLDFGASGGTGIEQVQADWGETNPESKAFIRRKPVLSKVATSGSYEDLSGLPTIPVLPEGIVIDADYVHTDNNYTSEEKEKLAGLQNYDDTSLRTALQDEINRATEAEGNLDAAVKKVASDFAVFLSSDPDADDLINRWQEVTAFLNGITEDKTLSGMLLEMKTEINESVVTKLASYYTAARVDELFVKKLVGSRLITEEEATKLAGLHNYDDTTLVNRVNTLENKQPAVLDITDWYTLAYRTIGVRVENLEIPSGWKEFLEAGVSNGLTVTFIGQFGEKNSYSATITKNDILGAITYRVYFHFIYSTSVMSMIMEMNYDKGGTPTTGSCIMEYVLDISEKADAIKVKRIAAPNESDPVVDIYEIEPNVFYDFDICNKLHLSLKFPVPMQRDKYYEHTFQFIAATDNIPFVVDGVQWMNEIPAMKANCVYEVSIVNFIGIIGGSAYV